jgi:UDP-glucuronate decarboxylase
MSTNDSFTGPVNLGNPNEFTVLQLAETIVALTKSRSKLMLTILPADDPKQRQPDISLRMRFSNGNLKQNCARV